MNKKEAEKFSRLTGNWDSLLPFKIDKIVDGQDGLEIYVSGTRGGEGLAAFVFDVYYGYRNFDEGDLWKRWTEIGTLTSGLYVADRSELLDWASEQSPHGELPQSVRNYLFVSIDDVLDVLAFEDPTFEFAK